jgi:hypothetical protein
MKLALYVHDFRIEVGHSNSLIELIRHLPIEKKRKIESIEVVSFVCGDLNKLFPEFKGKIKWVKVPFKRIGPSIIKSILFQAYTAIYNMFIQDRETFKIGIGICCLNVNAVSVQFIHHQWTKNGLKSEENYPLRYFYKKILFGYYELCENYLLQKKGIRFFSPAIFLHNYLCQKNPSILSKTIYSGINLDRFKLRDNKDEILQSLQVKHPVLSSINLDDPIYLFVGAYERKGIDRALEILKSTPGAQFIVVGSPSLGRKQVWPANLNVFPISFSKEIENFYTISDAFIFPTIYEPFGLVLFEAMAMGLTIFTNKNEVGASELLNGLPDIYFVDDKNFKFKGVEKKSFETKKSLIEQRMLGLKDVSWSKAGKEMHQFLFEN